MKDAVEPGMAAVRTASAPPSRVALDRDERLVKDGILRMGSLVESQIRDAIRALVDRDSELAARVIEALAPRKDIAARGSQIDVRDNHDAVVLLEDDAALQHVGDDKFLERLQSYVDLAPALREQVREIDYVDLRFGDRVYVRPARGR